MSSGAFRPDLKKYQLSSQGWSPDFFKTIPATLEVLLKLEAAGGSAGFLEIVNSFKPTPLTTKLIEKSFAREVSMETKFSSQLFAAKVAVETEDGHVLVWEKHPWIPMPDGTSVGTFRFDNWESLVHEPLYVSLIHGSLIMPMKRGDGELVGEFSFAEATGIWPAGDFIVGKGFELIIGPVSWKEL